MTPFLIAGGVTATLLVVGFSYLLGILIGTRKGVDAGFSLARDLYDSDEGEDDPYFRHYGGMIDAGRRGEN